MLSLSNIEAAAERGVVLVSPVTYQMSDMEDKLAADELREMCPAPSARRNAPYRIDSAGCVWTDIKRALKSLPLKHRRRVLLHYYYGYKYAEIAGMEGDNTEGAVKLDVKRSIEKMSEFLEAPPVVAPGTFSVTPRDDSHRRKYASHPTYA